MAQEKEVLKLDQTNIDVISDGKCTMEIIVGDAEILEVMEDKRHWFEIQ